MLYTDLAITGVLQIDRRLLRQLPDALDRVDLARDFREHGCRVTGAGTDLKHAFAAFELQSLDHEGDDVGLGYGLAAADWERTVRIGTLAKFGRNEAFARHSLNGLQHSWVLNAPRSHLPPDHGAARVAHSLHACSWGAPYFWGAARPFALRRLLSSCKCSNVRWMSGFPLNRSRTAEYFLQALILAYSRLGEARLPR